MKIYKTIIIIYEIKVKYIFIIFIFHHVSLMNFSEILDNFNVFKNIKQIQNSIDANVKIKNGIDKLIKSSRKTLT